MFLSCCTRFLAHWQTSNLGPLPHTCNIRDRPASRYLSEQQAQPYACHRPPEREGDVRVRRQSAKLSDANSSATPARDT